MEGWLITLFVGVGSESGEPFQVANLQLVAAALQEIQLQNTSPWS
jgi:hypothetical protein